MPEKLKLGLVIAIVVLAVIGIMLVLEVRKPTPLSEGEAIVLAKKYVTNGFRIQVNENTLELVYSNLLPDNVWVVEFNCEGYHSSPYGRFGGSTSDISRVQVKIDAYTGEYMGITAYPFLIITLDKSLNIYFPGDVIEITLKNVSNRSLFFTDNAYGLAFQRWDDNAWEYYESIRGEEMIIELTPGEEAQANFELGLYSGEEFAPGWYEVGTQPQVDGQEWRSLLWTFATFQVLEH